MSTHKHIDVICSIAIVFSMVITVLFMCGESLGIEINARTLGYEDRLFNPDEVHTLDIEMDDWDGFLETATSEEYSVCNLTIDGEKFSYAAIRGKGNTSLSNVANYGNNRYSLKIEFDHYDSSLTYHGLDKLCLNNIIQDNTYVKDYLTYRLMNEFGVDAPLCSFVYLTVNGEDFGLYLAVEGIEDSFLERNYGSENGDLYKPDSMSMGGGRGNGGDFDFDDWKDKMNSYASSDTTDITDNSDTTDKMTEQNQNGFGGNMPDISDFNPMQMPDNTNFDPTQISDMGDFDMSYFGYGNIPDMSSMPDIGNMGGMGSDDVSLIYSDDEYSSYSNIFDNAKTDVTDNDKDRLIKAIKNINECTELDSSVDIEEVIRYFVVHNFTVNFDSYTGSMIHNYYLYEEDGRLSMIPWDYNLAFGGFQSTGSATSLVNYPIDTPVSGGTVDSRPMLAWIFSSDEYTEQYHTLFAEFISEYFESGYVSKLLSDVKAMIESYVEKDPTKFCTYDEFETGIDTLITFVEKRAESIKGQLDGTIPSTSDGQSADGSALIDASEITISDMGSMGNNGGGQGGNHGGNGGFDFGGNGNTDAYGNKNNMPIPNQNGNGQYNSKSNASFQSLEASEVSASAVKLESSGNSMPSMPNGGQGGNGGGNPPDMQGGFDSSQYGGGDMPDMSDIPDMSDNGDFNGNVPSIPDGNGENNGNETRAPLVTDNADDGQTVSEEKSEKTPSDTEEATTDNVETGENDKSAETENENQTGGNIAKPNDMYGQNNGQKGNTDMKMPDDFGGQTGDGQNNKTTVILLALSFVILAFGITVAAVYKKRV